MNQISHLIIEYKYAVIIFWISIAFVSGVSAQEPPDTLLLKNIFNQKADAKNYSSYYKESESTVKIFVSAGFLVYKKFISSQDVDACVFTPSCSEYAMEAIDKKGITGLFDGLDRLLRCHPFVGKNDYPYNSLTKKYNDPF